MKITCPFCYAQVICADVPLYCPHCGTKFKEDDDFQKELTWYEKSLKLEVR